MLEICLSYTYQPAPAECEVLDSVALEKIRHLLQHRRLVQVELVRASGTPTNHAEEESAHTRTEASAGASGKRAREYRTSRSGCS